MSDAAKAIIAEQQNRALAKRKRALEIVHAAQAARLRKELLLDERRQKYIDARELAGLRCLTA